MQAPRLTGCLLLCRLHVDGAHAGVAAILPEQRHHFCGVELAGSFNTNPHRRLSVQAPRLTGCLSFCRLHVDGAHAGVAAILPEQRHHFCGVELAGSFSVNPHRQLRVLAPRLTGCLSFCRLHVDGAHAGVAAILPEQRHHFCGVELADSFNTNPHKWLLTTFDCSCIWFRDADPLKAALSLTPAYLRGKGNAYDYQVTDPMSPSSCMLRAGLEAATQAPVANACMRECMCNAPCWIGGKLDIMEACQILRHVNFDCRTGRSRWGGASAP